MTTRFPPLIIIVNLVLASASPAQVSVVGQNSNTALNYSAQTSATDLINAGQATLASATVSTTFGASFPGSGITDGAYSNTTTDNAFFAVANGNFPATATYNLNTTANPSGYDITSIKSFMGWLNVNAAQGNQSYTIEISLVGSASYSTYATVSYSPFTAANSGGSYESMVTVTDTSGKLATGVDSIRFTFSSPGSGGSTPGTVVREIDVIGYPTAVSYTHLTLPTNREV